MIENTNYPVLSVEKVIEKLGFSYGNIIKSGLPAKTFPSVMLWGSPGVGKSQAIRQLAKNLEVETGKKVIVTDVRLLLFNPIDLRGIPTSNEDKTLAVWLKPKIFQMDDSEDVVNILFLDEISAAPQSVQAAAYQITLDRTVGEHRLPENCFVLAAGNRVTDKSVAYKMPKALANRLLHIEVAGSFDSWINWAVGAGINAKVLGYLSFRSDRLFCFDATNDDLAFATPRSWEMVSNILNCVNDDPEAMNSMIAGLIGNGAAVEFMSWCRVFKDLPSMEDIFGGKPVKVPHRTDILYALVSSMTIYAREHKDDCFAIGNSIRFATSFPPEYSTFLIQNYRAIEKDYESVLMEIPEYLDWARKRGAYRNGEVR